MKTQTKKTRNAFPKIMTKCGGYTACVRFEDEARGEQYFDTEWNIFNYSVPGQFSISCPVNYCGRLIPDNPAGNSLGLSLRVGDVVGLDITRWSMRGRSGRLARSITVRAFTIDESGTLTIDY